MTDIRVFFILLFVVLLIDVPFIMLIFRPKIWDKTIKDIQGEEIGGVSTNKIIGFIVAYALIPLGIYLFVFPQITKDDWLRNCVIFGFLWGFITYGIFDFTNLALFNKYPLDVAVIDTIWGGVMTTISLIITYLISRQLQLI